MEERRQTTGMIMAAIVNSAPFGDKDRKARGPLDFFPDPKAELEAERRRPVQTAEDHERFLTAIFKRPPEQT